MSELARPLGALPPPDYGHVEKYPLRTALEDPAAPLTMPMPVCVAMPWYHSFDHPSKRADGHYWLPEPAGGVRGWHEICLKPPAMTDYLSWWRFYDQGQEGACVGFAMSRMMTLKNRGRYDARWLYNQARDRDPWPPDMEGTHARYAGEVLVQQGHKFPAAVDPRPSQGISEFRWAESVEEIKTVLGERRGFTVALNSWGEFAYPHLTRIPDELLQRNVFTTGGDAVVVVDR